MSEQSDAEIVQTDEVGDHWLDRLRSDDDDQMSNLPLLVAVLVYGSVSLSLFAVTGNPHTGGSFPIVFAMIGIVVAFGYEVRYRE